MATAPIDPCELLRQADKAWFELNTGGAVRSVRDQNNEEVIYSSANRQGLMNMIYALQKLCPTYQSMALMTAPRPLKYFY